MIDPQELTSRKTTLSYPYVLIENPSKALPAIIKNLEKGDIQVVIEFKGQRKCACKISYSAYNMNNLLRCTGPFLFVKSETEQKQINTIDDYFEV